MDIGWFKALWNALFLNRSKTDVGISLITHVMIGAG